MQYWSINTIKNKQLISFLLKVLIYTDLYSLCDSVNITDTLTGSHLTCCLPRALMKVI